MNAAQEFTLRPVLVGHYQGPDGNSFLPVSAEELERAREASQRVINSFKLEMGRHVLISSLLDEAVQCLPVERAVMNSNLVVCSVDGSSFDAARFESVLRRFDVAAVAVVGEPTLDGLESLDYDPLKLLDGKAVWARAGAYRRLDGKGLRLLRWLELGPAVAAECCHANGAHIDRIEWDVEEDNGELVLNSRLPRCVEFEHYRTGVRGRIEHTPCACGNPDPRIFVSDE